MSWVELLEKGVGENPRRFGFSVWRGEVMGGTFIGFEVFFKKKDLPEGALKLNSHDKVHRLKDALAFATASTGEDSFVIPVEQIGNFILAHQLKYFVCQNIEIDFFVVKALLEQNPAEQLSLKWWWEIVNQCRMRDVLLLDVLIRLAQTDDFTNKRELCFVFSDYCDVQFKNMDDWSWGQRAVEESISFRCSLEKLPIYEDNEMVSLAVGNVIGITQAYLKMHQKAIDLMNKYFTEMYEFSLKRFGPLSEGIQVKGTIALVGTEINGIHIDTHQVDTVKKKMEQKLNAAIQVLLKDPLCEGLFKLTIEKDGQLFPAPDEVTKKPSIKQDKLKEILDKVAAEIYEKYNIQIIFPVSRGNKPSFSRKKWGEYEQYHPFLRHWLEMERSAHFLSFLSHIESDVVHPEYTCLVRNGRTSCKSPPLQQTPRTGGFREVFTASPGSLLVTIDYKYIELCTLATVCEARYGGSVLANIIRQGYDPHSFTASMFERVPFQEFMSWRSSPDKELQKKYTLGRQRAKAINFGIPSGLSSRGLAEYAKSEYGIELSDKEAYSFRNTLITVVYPEMGKYLAESELQTLAANLGCSMEECIKKFTIPNSDVAAEKQYGMISALRNIIRGQPTKKNGDQYSQFLINKVWSGLSELVRSQDVFSTLTADWRNGSEQLYKSLLGKDVTTLTGRIRGKVAFTQACNTPFSGLAADGAKLAMWDLMHVRPPTLSPSPPQEGYKIVAFIHDEILIEIPEPSDWDKEIKLINDITCSAMRQLTGSIPIQCEYSLSTVWSKEAKAIYKNGKIAVWRPS